MSKKILSSIILFFFLFQEMGRTQIVGSSSSQVYPTKDSSSLLDKESRLSQKELRTLEARERYLREEAQQREAFSSKLAEKNLALIQKYNEQVAQTLTVDRLNQKQTTESLQQASEKIKNRLKRAEYVLHKDGSREIFNKAGRLIEIRNEKVQDGEGNELIRHTVNIKRDKKSGLVEAFDQIIIDEAGNRTRVKWRDGEYETVPLSKVKPPKRLNADQTVALPSEVISEPTEQLEPAGTVTEPTETAEVVAEPAVNEIQNPIQEKEESPTAIINEETVSSNEVTESPLVQELPSTPLVAEDTVAAAQVSEGVSEPPLTEAPTVTPAPEIVSETPQEISDVAQTTDVQTELMQKALQQLAEIPIQVEGFVLADNAGAIALYDTKGRLQQYQDGKGLEVTLAYDSQDQIIQRTEKTAEATRTTFNWLFDELGRLESHQFIDSRLPVQFSEEDVNTQTFQYKEGSGELLEVQITNSDFVATFDPEGNQTRIELSAQMQAFAEAEQQKEIERVLASRHLVSRKETYENQTMSELFEWRLRDIAGNNNPQGLIQEDQLRRDLDDLIKQNNSDAFLNFVKRLGVTDDQIWKINNGRLRLNPYANDGPEAVQISNKIMDAILASAPNLTVKEISNVVQVHRIESEYEMTDAQGRRHLIYETARVDGNGKQIDRVERDSVTIEYQVSTLTRTALFDSENRPTEIKEEYFKSAEEGYYTSTRLVRYDASGNILSDETSENFDPKSGGFFGSVFGKILSSVLVGAATFLAPYLLPALTPAVAGVIGASIAQAGLSLAQGADIKDALISGGIAGATALVGAQLGKVVSGVTPQGSWLNQFGTNLSQVANPTLAQAGESVATKFLQNAVIRATSTLVADKFGEKLGAFGTAGLLTAGALLFGGLADAGPEKTLTLNSLTNIALQSAAQGGVAEAFKNENGLAAQALSQLAGYAVGAIDFSSVAQQLSNVVKGAGAALTALNPFTESVAFAADEPITLDLSILERNEPQESSDLAAPTVQLNFDNQTIDGLKVVGEVTQQSTQFDLTKINEAILKIDSAMRKATFEIGAGAFLGDIIDKPTSANMVGQFLGGFFPHRDLQDTIVTGIKYYNDPTDARREAFTVAVIGWMPGAGDLIKKASKLSRFTRDGIQYNPLNKGPLADEIAQTFRSGTYTERIKPNPTKLYRVVDPGIKSDGNYWTSSKPTGPVQSIVDSSLDPKWGNKATGYVEMTLPSGETFFEGFSASQGGLVGGGNQIYVPKVDPKWVSDVTEF